MGDGHGSLVKALGCWRHPNQLHTQTSSPDLLILIRFFPNVLTNNPIETTINPHQISHSICRNAASNLQGSSTVLLFLLQMLSIYSLSKQSTANGQNISNFGLIGLAHLLSLSSTPLPVVFCITKSLGLVSMRTL